MSAATKSKSGRKAAEDLNPDFHLPSIGNYVFIKTLGEGNFAKVKLAKHKLTSQEVAIKIIDKTQLEEKKIAKLYREVRIMKMLHHPHIVRLYEVIETRCTVFLVMEYSSGGELYDYLVVHGRMKEKEARAKFRQILSAMSYCHKKRIIHRDLKAENLLLDGNLDVKIADFGFSNQFDPEGKLDTFCGSPPYAAPELFQGRRYVGPEVDIWSLGVILYVLTTGCLPFDGKNLAEMREAVCRGRYRVPFYLSDNCEKLLRKLMTRDATKRASLEILIDDPWILEGYNTSPISVDISGKVGEDENLMRMIAAKFNISIDQILRSLRENLYDDISALYYLMYHERDRSGGDYGKISQLLSAPNSPSITSCPDPAIASPVSNNAPQLPLLAPNFKQGSTLSGSHASSEAQKTATAPSVNDETGVKKESKNETMLPSHLAASALNNQAAVGATDSTAHAADYRTVPRQPTGSTTEKISSSGPQDATPGNTPKGIMTLGRLLINTAGTTVPAGPSTATGTVPPLVPQPTLQLLQQQQQQQQTRRRRFTMGSEPRSSTQAAADGTKADSGRVILPGVARAQAGATDQIGISSAAAGGGASVKLLAAQSSGGAVDADDKPNEMIIRSTSLGESSSENCESRVTESKEICGEKHAQLPAKSGTASVTLQPSSTAAGAAAKPEASTKQEVSGDAAFRKRNNTIVGIIKSTITRPLRGNEGATASESTSIVEPNEEGKPRSLRFTFNSNTTSSKPPDEIVAALLETCNKLAIQNKLMSRYLVECAYQISRELVKFEVEVCKLPRLNNVHGLRFKRISGSSNEYKLICESILATIVL